MRPGLIKDVLACCYLVAILLPGVVLAQQPDPVVLVQELYSQFRGECSPETSDLELLRAMAAPELAGLLDREMACQSQGDICSYDFSVIVNGQDCQLNDLDIKQTRMTDAKTTVTATFQNMGQPSKVAYDFIRIGSAWQLANVRVAGDPPVSLLQLLK